MFTDVYLFLAVGLPCHQNRCPSNHYVRGNSILFHWNHESTQCTHTKKSTSYQDTATLFITESHSESLLGIYIFNYQLYQLPRIYSLISLEFTFEADKLFTGDDSLISVAFYYFYLQLSQNKIEYERIPLIYNEAKHFFCRYIPHYSTQKEHLMASWGKGPTQVEYVSMMKQSDDAIFEKDLDQQQASICTKTHHREHSWQKIHLETWLNSWTETNKLASKFLFIFFSFLLHFINQLYIDRNNFNSI